MKTNNSKHITSLLFLLFLILSNNSFSQQKEPKATKAETKLSFRDIPELKEPFINATPIDKKEGIPVGKLGIDGGNKTMILKLAKEIGDHKHSNFDSFLIFHKDKLIFESYYSKGRINLPHPQASATKVYTSMAIGRAIQLGYLTMADLDKPIASFLKDLDPTKFAKGADKITLHQALTMRSGIRISDEQRDELEKNPNKIQGQQHVQAYFEHTTPITFNTPTFKYQNDPMLVMQVLDAVVPGSAKDFIKRELLDKLSISNYVWRTDINGLPRSGNRTSMTSRDMVKWGMLAKNKGKWKNEQLIPEAFIDRAIHRIVRHSDDENFLDVDDISNVGYGYFWWQADMKVGNKNYFSTSAQGGSGQTIILIDELDLIVVTTVHRLKISALQLVAERVLPAFVE